jgi:hypothetical protein
MQTIGRRETRYLACGGPRSTTLGAPVNMPRNSDCDMCLDDQDAAATQRKYPVNEPGRVHGASELDIVVLSSIHALMWPQNRIKEEKRRWIINQRKLSQLRARDKTGRARLGFWGGFQVVSRVPFMFTPVPMILVQRRDTADLHGTTSLIAAETPR